MDKVTVSVEIDVFAMFEELDDDTLIRELELRGIAVEDTDNTQGVLAKMHRAHYLLISGKEAEANAILQDHMLEVMGRAVV